MIKRIYLLLFVLLCVFNGCNIVKPFFIKNKKKEARKEKRVEKKEERKHDKGNLVTVVIDSSDYVKKDSLKIPTFDTLLARQIIANAQKKYTTFQSKAKLHFESEDQKQSFNANFRMLKGKVIWVSINAPIIGEVARAIITPDSVKAMEKINKRKYLYSYKDIQKLINIEVDFNTLQEIIIGNAIATDGHISDIKELGPLSTIFIVSPEYNNQLTFNKGDSTLKQMQMQTMRSSVSTSSLLIAMTQYDYFEGRHFPIGRTYHIQDVKGAVQLDMDINKYDFDKELDFPFSIPATYKLK
jgi:hypothetical protein